MGYFFSRTQPAEPHFVSQYFDRKEVRETGKTTLESGGTAPEVQMRWRHSLICFLPTTVTQYALQKDIKRNPQILKGEETNYP